MFKIIFFFLIVVLKYDIHIYRNVLRNKIDYIEKRIQFIENNSNSVNNQITKIIINDDDYDDEFDNSYIDEMNEIALQEFNDNIENIDSISIDNMTSNTSSYGNEVPQFTEPLGNVLLLLLLIIITIINYYIIIIIIDYYYYY